MSLLCLVTFNTMYAILQFFVVHLVDVGGCDRRVFRSFSKSLIYTGEISLKLCIVVYYCSIEWWEVASIRCSSSGTTVNHTLSYQANCMPSPFPLQQLCQHPPVSHCTIDCWISSFIISYVALRSKNKLAKRGTNTVMMSYLKVWPSSHFQDLNRRS